MQIQNLPVYSFSHENYMLKVSDYTTAYFLRYTHPYLWNVGLKKHRETIDITKISLLLRKNYFYIKLLYLDLKSLGLMIYIGLGLEKHLD